MAKPQQTQPEPKKPTLAFSSFHPTANDYFRMKRAPGLPLWCVEVTRIKDGKVEFVTEMDPPDTIDSIQRKLVGLVQEAERR